MQSPLTHDLRIQASKRARNTKKTADPILLLIAIALIISSLPLILKVKAAINTKKEPITNIPSALSVSEPMQKCDIIEWSMNYAGSIYDVPLSVDEQHYVFDTALEFDIDPPIIFGIMYTESRYTHDAISASGKDIGIMQINLVNCEWLYKNLGITDIYDFKQNVRSGSYMISKYYKKYNDISKALMCYHYGEAGAKRIWESGIETDNYCKTVIAEAARLSNR